MRAQFGGQHVTAFARQSPRLHRMRVPEFAQLAHRRQHGKTVAEPLHATAFVVYRNQQMRRAQRADRLGQFEQLRRRGVIARKQNDAAHQRVRQAAAVVVGKRGAGHVEHDGAEAHEVSNMTKAMT